MSGYGHIEHYTDTEGRHRWRAIAGNGEILADSGQSYTEHRNAEDGLRALTRLLTGGVLSTPACEVRTVPHDPPPA